MSWLSKIVPKPVKNFVRAPDRITKSVLSGDIKKAASIFVSPYASSQATRDRTLRRAGGVITGAVAGFVTGGPAGAVAGGVIGGVRAKKGKGQLKDYLKTAAISVAAGGVVGGVTGALGFPQYGGMAGNWGASLNAPAQSPFDPVTGEYTSNYLSSTGGGGSSFPWISVGKTAAGLSSVLPMLQPGQPLPLTEEAPMDFPFAPYIRNESHPLSTQYVPQSSAASNGASSDVPLLIGLGAILLFGVFNG